MDRLSQSIGSGVAASTGTDPLCRALREIISAPIHDTQAWAHATLGAIARLGEVAHIGSSFTIEFIEPDTGRCQVVATSHVPVETGVLAAERGLLDVTGSRGISTLRVILHARPGTGPAPFITPEFRAALVAAVESFESHIWVVVRRRREIRNRLTDAQRRVLEFMIADLSEREIGERVGRSQHTVHDHVKGIYAALGIASRGELLVLWHGGVTLGPGAAVGAAGLTGPAGFAGLAGGTPNVPTSGLGEIHITTGASKPAANPTGSTARPNG